MKSNHFAILPAQVRYDSTLTATAILLYGELGAASDAYGICDENLGYFASALRVDNRTISRALGLLLEANHVQRVEDNGKRKLKIVTLGVGLQEGVTVIVDKKIDKESSGWVEMFIDIWEEKLKVKLDNHEEIAKKLLARLQVFSKEELIKAMQNRIEFINSTPYYQTEEGFFNKIDITQVINDDKLVLKWLSSSTK